MSGGKRSATLNSDSDASSSLEGEPPIKQSKSSKPFTYEKSANGDKLIDLTGRKYVSVRSFRGRMLVDIREYYEDKSDGGLKPGKKGIAVVPFRPNPLRRTSPMTAFVLVSGISLNAEQWENLKNLADVIDSSLKKTNP